MILSVAWRSGSIVAGTGDGRVKVYEQASGRNRSTIWKLAQVLQLAGPSSTGGAVSGAVGGGLSGVVGGRGTVSPPGPVWGLEFVGDIGTKLCASHGDGWVSILEQGLGGKFFVVEGVAQG